MLLTLQAGPISGGKIIAVLENHESIGARISGTRSGEGGGDCAIFFFIFSCQMSVVSTKDFVASAKPFFNLFYFLLL